MKKTPSKESLFSVCSEAQTSETFAVGEIVKTGDRIGRVAFVGRTQFQPGEWVGLIFDTPNGKNNGSVNGIKYFECQERHGLFCRPFKLVKIAPTNSTVAPFSPPSVTGVSVSGARSPTNSIYSVAFSVAASQAGGSREHSPYAAQFGFDISDRVITDDGRAGKVKFLNFIATEIYAGIILDRPLGDSDGKFQGIQYFKCYPKYAVFLPAHQLKKAAATIASNALHPKKAPRSTKASQLRTEKGGANFGAMNGAAFKGSRESLDSLVRSPPPASYVTISNQKQSPSGVKDGDIFISLKKCLQEKEGHLAQLSIELSERSNDADRLAQENRSLKLRVGELDAELNSAKRELVVKCQEMQRGIDERDKRLDDISFCFTEAELKNEELEQRVKEMHSTVLPTLLEETKPNMITFGLQTEQTACLNSYMQTEQEQKPKMVTFGLQTEQTVYLDSYMQTEQEQKPKMFTFGLQTDRTESIDSNMQTEPEHKLKPTEFTDSDMQTEPEMRQKMNTVGIQTDRPESIESDMQTEPEQKLKPTEFTDSDMQTEPEVRQKMNTLGNQTDRPEFIECDMQTEPEQKLKPSEFTDSDMQTEPEVRQKMNTLGLQTDRIASIDSNMQTVPEEKPKMNTFGLQTEQTLCLDSDMQTEPEQKPTMVTLGLQTNLTKCIDSEMQTLSEDMMEAQKISSNNVGKDGEVLELNVSKLHKDADSSFHSNHGRGSPLLDETLRRKYNNKCEEMGELRQAFEFQQSIIARQVDEIARFKQQQPQNGMPKNGSSSALCPPSVVSTPTATTAHSPVCGGLATVSGRVRAPPRRTYCEHCELFDSHDTVDCPKEEAKQTEKREHLAISPRKKDEWGLYFRH